MAHPSLKIFGYSEAAMFVRQTPRPNVIGIISIHGSREFEVEAAVPHRLDLVFDDVEIAMPDDVMAMQRATSRKRWLEKTGATETIPVAADVAAIIQLAEQLRGQEGIVLCHCGGGMSRAPAAALICLAVWRGPGAEIECVTEIRNIRNGAVPHAGLIRLADQLLKRDNQLVHALAVLL